MKPIIKSCLGINGIDVLLSLFTNLPYKKVSLDKDEISLIDNIIVNFSIIICNIYCFFFFFFFLIFTIFYLHIYLTYSLR
jgi:hypothetical protein